MDTRYGTIMGAAIFNNCLGLLEIPVDQQYQRSSRQEGNGWFLHQFL